MVFFYDNLDYPPFGDPLGPTTPVEPETNVHDEIKRRGVEALSNAIQRDSPVMYLPSGADHPRKEQVVREKAAMSSAILQDDCERLAHKSNVQARELLTFLGHYPAYPQETREMLQDQAALLVERSDELMRQVIAWHAACKRLQTFIASLG